MRSRRPSPEHEQAVARRLALLSAELAAVQPARPATPVDASKWPWEEHTRVRPGGPHALVQDAPAELPGRVDALHREGEGEWTPVPGPAVRLPVPGRHAARRGTGLLPPGLQGRVALRHQHLTVVAVAVVAGLAWTCWWLLRSAAEPELTPVVAPDVSPVAAASTESGPAEPGPRLGTSPPAASATAPGTGAVEVVVDVAGKVRRPGIVVLPSGARVADALEAAGGARPAADLTSVNLARVLVDGEQVLVGVGPVAGAPAPAGPPPAAAAGLVNLNTADQTTLETLPGVGPVTAAAIMAWRSEHGGFSSVSELLEVNGIGEVTLDELTPLVTV